MYSLKKEQLDVAVQKILEGGSLPALDDELNSQELQESIQAICPSCPQTTKPDTEKPDQPVGRRARGSAEK